VETAKQILSFATILEGDKIPGNFLKNWYSLFDWASKEFENSTPVGQAYRQKCFEYVKTVVFRANKHLGDDYPKELLTIQPILQKLNASNKIIGSIAEQLATKAIKDPVVLFHMHCYAYLVLLMAFSMSYPGYCIFLTLQRKAKFQP
jgi:hypothetical protein